MKTPLFFIVPLLTFFSANAQTNSSSLSGTLNYSVGTIYVEMASLTEAIEKDETPASLFFSPNPVKDRLVFSGSQTVSVVRVFDMSGRMLLQKNVENNSVELSVLPKGTYIMITDLNNYKGYKFLKE